jgi:hypothetical protein
MRKAIGFAPTPRLISPRVRRLLHPAVPARAVGWKALNKSVFIFGGKAYKVEQGGWKLLIPSEFGRLLQRGNLGHGSSDHRIVKLRERERHRNHSKAL